MKKEDKDLLDKIHISLITVVPSYQEIHDFVLADREEQKGKVKEMLNIGLKHSKGKRKECENTRLGWQYSGAIDAFKQIKKKLEGI